MVAAPALIGLAAVAVGGIAFASIPSSDGTISGCYSTAKLLTRIGD